MNVRFRLAAALAFTTTLAGCQSSGDIVVNQGVGITAVRSTCPAVGIPDYTGDITTFTTPGNYTTDALDVSASMTNLRFECAESSDEIYATATFDVLARRSDVRGARQVTLPYFVTVVRGGSAIVSKKVGSVTVAFADGQDRAVAQGTAASYINRAEATLPDDIRDQITRRRKPGDPDAAVDPLTRPEVRAAVARASFEMLLGFQLTEDQLRYNATR
ncbi:efflux RND transporter permease subunit [Pseudoblastomonas halimionae]|uniref:Lipoprotein n=1 Tax=Alteriqipengyuania halimionae TaxID=1926630 RepID=A0A6I4U381_9SPHN|nr:efflux RND transporter permease subunit [Alteriqipengyuania halimionae]MXP10176.1 hypothetical protein [Alteriqipengyuania halimionae]